MMTADLQVTSIDTTPDTQSDAPASALAALWKEYSLGGQGSAAEDELMEMHLDLVKTVVDRFAVSLPASINVRDLHSAGRFGLLGAIRRFDWRAGAEFTAYARLRIEGAVLDELRKRNWVPFEAQQDTRYVRSAMDRIEARSGRHPEEAEIAGDLNLSVEEYRKLVETLSPATFVTTRPAPAEESAGARRTPATSFAARLAERIHELPELHRQVLAFYYTEDLRLQEIAVVLGISEPRVCQLHAEAILALGNVGRDERLPGRGRTAAVAAAPVLRSHPRPRAVRAPAFAPRRA